MLISDFKYDLPEELIAQAPHEPRDHSRLLVMDKATGQLEHQRFDQIIDYLRPTDLLVVNNSKVFPARLHGFKETGGKFELLLNKNLEGPIWEVIGKGLKVGLKAGFADSDLAFEVISQDEQIYQINFNKSGEDLFSELDKIGHTPLPPYIKKADSIEDKSRYQTVYAKPIGSAAAPTAGLHFTPELMEKIKAKGIELAEVTLHVGLGTFSPVKEEVVEDHQIHSENYSVTQENLAKIIKAKAEGRRIVAIGTTTTRVLEHLYSFPNVEPRDLAGSTEIFIYPPYQFKCVDALVTNFHLPASTLLVLVSAFAGRENILNAYKEAVTQRYRFFSYGDAMFIA